MDVTEEKPITVMFGTVTGNSEVLAEETSEELDDVGIPNRLISMNDFDPQRIHQIDKLLLIISTDSGGVPPYMAEDLYQYLSKEIEADLNHLVYSVLALGDTYYPNFCQAGKDFDHMLNELGARRVVERVDCDIRFWDDFDYWLDSVKEFLEQQEWLEPANV